MESKFDVRQSAGKMWLCNRKEEGEKAAEQRRRWFRVWLLPKETGKDRKIIGEGCLIWRAMGGGGERTAGFSTARVRGLLNQIN